MKLSHTRADVIRQAADWNREANTAEANRVIEGEEKPNVRITLRQLEVLNSLKNTGCVGSSSDGSVLRALAKKGLVFQHHNQAPGYVYYTWTINKSALNTTFTII